MDGTGKTAHALQTISYLQKAGHKCKYVWFGTPYFFSLPFMVICRLLGYTRTRRAANGAVISEHQYYRNKLISKLWSWVQFFDVFVWVNVRVRLPLLFGFRVVCDRFVPDTLVELMVDTQNMRLAETLVGRLMIKLIPKSSKLVLLDVKEKTAWRRKKDVPVFEYLTRRRRGYHIISNDLQIPMVNAESSFGVVQRALLARLVEEEPKNDI